MPVAEVVTVRRGTAISAVYGTVRIEPAFVVRIRAQNDGFIQLAEAFSAAVEAGLMAHNAGPMEQRDMAAPSTPVIGKAFLT